MRKRNRTRPVFVGGIQVGGQDKVVIQTMIKSRPKNTNEAVREINALATEGAEIIRTAVLDMEDARAIKTLKAETTVPLVADIHFDYRLAIEAIESGADKIRINPGNVGSEARLRAVVEKAKEKSIPIRIGINAGSLEKDLEKAYGRTAEAMIESARRNVTRVEAFGFEDIILSLKASDVPMAIEAALKAAEIFPYPLHLGITEAGPVYQGTIASSAGLGAILSRGIGDTIRISLSGERSEELKACKTLLSAFGLYTMPKLISCPTCGRLSYDMQALLDKVERYLEAHPSGLKIAIMGCAVNGPGEARDADIGIAGGKKEGLLFIKGKTKKKVPQEALYETLIETIENYDDQ